MRLARVFCALAACLCAAHVPAALAQDAPTPAIRRWLDVDLAELATRYRLIETSAGVVTNNQLQHRQRFRARFKFDAQGRYAIHTGVFTGSNIIGGWNNTGIGTGGPGGTINVKQLFAAAAPVGGLVVQAGGLYPARGEHTEITTYDEDAYMMGARVQVMRPGEIWLDEVTFTTARIDAREPPNVFERFDGFDDQNYRQILLRKRFGAVAASTGFTTLQGAHTVRAAVAAAFAPATLRLEAYRRVRQNASGGFAIAAERAIARALRVSAGFATIDPLYGGLNGDRFLHGDRVFGTATMAFSRWLNLSIFITRGVGNDVPLANRTRFDAVLSYNLLDTLRRTGIF